MTFLKWIWCDTTLLMYPNIKCTFWSTCLAIAKMRAGKNVLHWRRFPLGVFFLFFFFTCFYYFNLDLYILDWQCWNVLKCSETLNKMVYNKLYHLYIIYTNTQIYICIYIIIYMYIPFIIWLYWKSLLQ